ncbi:hypothetical protein ACFU7Y_35280 [Kitasatospora sp. NPDC057542]|uniref:hypothetical protein n=2 Tax=Streptomycetaceae TaxID=2062 RepID=UPI00368EFB53
MSRQFPRTAVALAVLASGLLTTWNAPRSVARSPGTRSAGRAVPPSGLSAGFDVDAAPGTGVTAGPGESADRSAAGRHAVRHADGMRPGDTGTVDEELGNAPQTRGNASHVVSDLFPGVDAAGPARPAPARSSPTAATASSPAASRASAVPGSAKAGPGRSASVADALIAAPAAPAGPAVPTAPITATVSPAPAGGFGTSPTAVAAVESVPSPAGTAGSAESAEPAGHAARPLAPQPKEAAQGAAGRPGEAGLRDGLVGVLLVLTGLELITRRVVARRAGAPRR